MLVDYLELIHMNNQEREQISRFLNQLGEIKLTAEAKDSEAEQLIRSASSNQPDAVYLLVQRALLLEQALQTAKGQISDLQNQLQSRQPAVMGSFLDNDPWGQAAGKSRQVPGADRYAMPQNTQQPPVSAFGGGTSSFLGNVATTAAGVVAGSFLFQGIGNLMGHHASPWEHQAADVHEPASETTTINNFYDDTTEPSSIHDASYQVDEDDSFQNDSDSDWI
jgi:hypothetical protein